MLRLIGKPVVRSAFLLTGFALCAVPALARPKSDLPKPLYSAVFSPDAHVFGATLTDWLGAYWRWSYTSDTSAPYKPGPGNLVFVPIPAGIHTGGTGAPDDPNVFVGQLEVTLRPGTPFVLPFFAWIAERYQPELGIPDDPFIADEFIRDTIMNPDPSIAEPTLTLDGRPVLRDFWDFYVGPAPFEPLIAYPVPTGYGSVAAIGFQGGGAIFKPLTPGRHVLHLAERMRITDAELPGFTFGTIYDNTWIINVVPPGREGKADKPGPNGPKDKQPRGR